MKVKTFTASFICRNCEGEFQREIEYGIDLVVNSSNAIEIVKHLNPSKRDIVEMMKPNDFVTCEFCGSWQISRKYRGALSEA